MKYSEELVVKLEKVMEEIEENQDILRSLYAMENRVDDAEEAIVNNIADIAVNKLAPALGALYDEYKGLDWDSSLSYYNDRDDEGMSQYNRDCEASEYTVSELGLYPLDTETYHLKSRGNVELEDEFPVEFFRDLEDNGVAKLEEHNSPYPAEEDWSELVLMK